MEMEKEQINEQGDYEIISYDENGCKKCGTSLEEGREIKDSEGNIYCNACAKNTLVYRCSHCKKVFRLSNYSNYEYGGARRKALEDKRNCEASHSKHLTAQIEQPAKIN